MAGVVLVESGVQKFFIDRGESAGMRFIRFNAWVEDMISKTQPQLIIYEQAHHRGGHATDLLVGMATRVQEACARHGIECAAVHSSTLKKWATGKGNAEKCEMIKRAEALFPGMKIMGDDHADALLILRYAQEKYGDQ